MADHYLLAKVWRWHDNPLLTQLNQNDILYLWEEDFSSINLPFTELPHPKTYFAREHERNLKSFEESFPFSFKRIKKLDEIPSQKVKAYYFFDHYYLTQLSGLEVDFLFYHPNHFCTESLVRSALTTKNTFTDFRHRVEAKKVYQVSSQRSSQHSTEESVSLASLRDYFSDQKAHAYMDERNLFEAARAGTHFSLPLSQGVLSPQMILEQLREFELKFGETKSSYWIRFELLWREFFYFSQIFSTTTLYFPDAQKSAPLKKISMRSLLMELSREPLIKAMINELVVTGTMSNRCRQIFASYFVHLNLFDWRYGAYLFQYFLKDYDPSSNWGNWQYLAGVGRDARGLRYFNLKTQTERYDPSGSYLSKWADKVDFLTYL